MIYHSIAAHENSAISSLRLVKSTSFALTGGTNDNKIKLIDLSSNNQSLDFPRERNSLFSVDCLDIAPSCQFFVSGSKDTISTFDLVKRIETEGRVLPDKDQPLGCVVMNNSVVATVGANHRLYLFDLRQANVRVPIFTLNLGNDNLNCIATSASFEQIAVGGSNGSLYNVDLKSGTVTTDTIGESVNSVEIRDTVSLISTSTSSGSGSVKVVNNTGEVDFEFATSNKGNYRLNACFVGEHHIANGTDTGEVQVWSTNGTVKLYKQLSGTGITGSAGDILNDVQYDSSQNRLVSSSGNGVVHVWDGAV